MCQIADKALVVEPTSVTASVTVTGLPVSEAMGENPTSAHMRPFEVSSLTYTAVAESGRMSEHRAVTVTGTPSLRARHGPK
jgi:hypothetical protein